MKLYYKLPYFLLVLFILFDYGVFSPYAKGYGFLSDAKDETYQLVVANRLLDRQADDNIRVVAIESKDLSTGQDDICESLTWPIVSRSWFVDVLENLLVHKPKAIVIDFLFLTPSSKCPQYDEKLRRVIVENPNIFIALTKSSSENDLSITPDVIPGAIKYSEEQGKFGDAINYPFFYDIFEKNKQQRLGSANAMIDDHVITKASLWTETQRWLIPSLPTTVKAFVDGKSVEEVPNENPLINWRSSTHAAQNFTDVWLDDFNPEDGVDGQYKDKIVLIGTNMPARSVDVHAIPGNDKIPGVFVLSTIIDNIVNDDFIKTHPDWVSVLLTLLFITILFLSFDSQILTPHLGIDQTPYERFMQSMHNTFHMEIAGADLFLILEFSAIFFAYISLEIFNFYIDLSGPVLGGIAAFSMFSLLQGLVNKTQIEEGGLIKSYIADDEFEQLHVMSIKGLKPQSSCFGFGWLVKRINPDSCPNYDAIVEQHVANIFKTGVAKLDLFKDDDIFGAAFDERHYWWVSRKTSTDMELSIEEILEGQLDQFKEKEIVVVLSSLDISEYTTDDDQESMLCTLILDLLSKVNQQYSKHNSL